MAAQIVVAGASRPHPNETENGDQWAVAVRPDAVRIVVADGLGHGPEAAIAARAATEAVLQASSLDPAGYLGLCQAALQGTRGAAVSVAVIRPGQLTFAGIGNVEGILLAGGRHRRLLPDRGIVGGASRSLHPLVFEIADDWTFVLYTDGVRSRLRLDPGNPEHPQALADRILASWSRDSDDASVVVARPNAPDGVGNQPSV
jgi:serine phosphatase RsbU (regulator of sigma subunit)